MIFSNYIYIAFIVFFIYNVYMANRKEGLYVFSPLVLLYFQFCTMSLLPMAIYNDYIPDNLRNVTIISCTINVFFMLYFRRQYSMKVNINPPAKLYRPLLAQHRRLMLGVFVLMILGAGLYTGIPQALIAGVDVEDMRMTTDIGMGVVRAIPAFGIPYLVMEYYILNHRMSIIKAGSIGLILGALMFITTAARGGLLTYAMLFFVWFNIYHRGFKWYEYFGIFYFAKSIIATALKMLRGGNWGEAIDIWGFFDHNMMIFGANSIKLADYMESHPNGFLWGESYYYPLVRIIPRSIWPDKPVAIDYVYKEMVGYSFDGGGIYTTPDFDLYLNFGYWYVIPYTLWLLMVHKMFDYVACGKNFSFKIFVLVSFVCGIQFGPMIQNIEMYILFLVLFFFLNKRWRLV